MTITIPLRISALDLFFSSIEIKDLSLIAIFIISFSLSVIISNSYKFSISDNALWYVIDEPIASYINLLLCSVPS